MGKKIYVVLSMLCLFAVLLVGCKPKETSKVVASNKTWYLYQDQGENDTVSIKFLKNQRAEIKDITTIDGKVGINRFNNQFNNPKYTLDRDGKTITFKTAKTDLVLKIIKSYHENVYGKHMKGYYVQSGNDTYKFAYITKRDKQSNISKSQKTKSQTIAYDQLPDHIIDVNANTKPLTANNALIGNYDFSTIIDYRRTDGNLTINQNGTYQMTLTEHSAQKLTDKTDNKVVMLTEVETGNVQSLYGKIYLTPKNLLTINYYYHGQNQDKLLPKSVNLKVNSKSTGNQIDRAKIRMEADGDQLYLFSSDYTVRVKDGQKNTKANLLTKSTSEQTSLRDAITQTKDYYDKYVANPLTSNADLMQLVGAISDNHDKKVGNIGVNFGDLYGTNIQPSDYQGVSVNGSKQPLMQYIFLVSPSAYSENGPAVTTTKGKLLIYGSLDNKLFLLRQPDKDSTTVTWTMVKDFPLTVPKLKFSLN
ncbi:MULTISPECIES: hypothetical protein [Companilactobacillus]|uniref:Lipoprotein n=1 Tax=Companilactobacillus heilongjiangensis TaxID=1074467 RepID=A0A0K2LE65_9LACO|nr:hypothetical protein [Companilactobacillus heilongjiangensis]ALB29582.1 hypothetical protein JP39_09585 [Companilactobacillus heilongjiangensis]